MKHRQEMTSGGANGPEYLVPHKPTPGYGPGRFGTTSHFAVKCASGGGVKTDSYRAGPHTHASAAR